MSGRKPVSRDLRGIPSSRGLRETPKNWGKRRIVGVIRDGKYVDPETGKPIDISNRKLPDRVYINYMGGVE